MNYVVKTIDELLKEGWYLSQYQDSLMLSVSPWGNDAGRLIDYISVPMTDLVKAANRIGCLSTLVSDCGKKIVVFGVETSIWEAACKLQNNACAHVPINVGFNTVNMVCKICNQNLP